MACGYRVYKRVITQPVSLNRCDWSILTKFIPFTFLENIKMRFDNYTLYIHAGEIMF